MRTAFPAFSLLSGGTSTVYQVSVDLSTKVTEFYSPLTVLERRRGVPLKIA